MKQQQQGPPAGMFPNPWRGYKLAKRTLFPPVHRMKVQQPAPSTWSSQQLTATCLGHATTLVNIRGTTILTDPALVDRVGITAVPELTLGPRRLLPPALSVLQLPPLDVILLSHAHADHMDLATLELLPRDVPVIIPPRTSDIIAPLGFRDVREVPAGAGDSVVVAGARITPVRVTHYGRRGPWDRVKGRGYCGYLVEKEGASFFFGGDTAHTQFPEDTAPRGGVDLAIFGIGGYDPFVWNHATPEQAWDMARQLGARFFLPMHWGVFMLSDEPVEEPIRRLLAVAGGDESRIVGRTIGETVVVPPR